MKKKLWLVTALLLAILLLVCACNGGTTDGGTTDGGTTDGGTTTGTESPKNEDHIHAYTIKNVDDAYLKESTADGVLAYYYSCACGEKGTETFTLSVGGGNNQDADKEEHVYETIWTADEEKHWRACMDARCSATSDKALHTFGEWIVDTAATCQKTGTRHHVCTVCNKLVSETMPVEPTAHNYATTWTSDSTHHWYKCQNSGCTSVKDKTSHTFGAWVVDKAPTCTATGTRHHDCTVCGKTVSETMSTVSTAHNYASGWTSDSTHHWHKCQNSGCTSVKDKTSHTFGAWVVDKAPTCTSTGTRHRECTVCGKTASESIASLGHNYASAWTSDGENHWHECQNSGCTSVKDKAPHTYSSVYSADATYIYRACTEKGCTATSKTAHNMTFSVSGDNATLTKYKGSAASVIIPTTYNGNPVTSIGSSAFEYRRSLTSITIPNSVTSIGFSAFRECDSLTSITIPNSVTSIGSSAFSNCDSLTSITIPNSVTSIGERAFQNCDSLTSITIPHSVTSIDYCAFYGCSKLTSITIPNRVTSIDDGAFFGCSNLTSITIGKGVTSIGDAAFCYCYKLTSIHFNGTTARWNAIKKDSDWNHSTGAYTIYCTNGTLSK